ncbi:MAG: RNB domain-containing ribonuclease [Candidatus Eisenbacteria bacterium]|uniref:RNB domain-containing ribonuclease n=1 Tax=Eiseniibacteriota bacterium TaxID=2212470 RepID=A0A956NJW7_UNCEI|nr:RNB domain-containing ribonuclease [Candidatus Eisenbacteria bacterium]
MRVVRSRVASSKPQPHGEPTVSEHEPNRQHRSILQEIAHRAMLERGLEPDFPPAAAKELGALPAPSPNGVRDLTALLWCSIDNDDSRDIDQLTAAESVAGGGARIYVAIADVDVLVAKGSAIDGHAQRNTTSVYTAAQIFPMLPEELSTDRTSLNLDLDRLAIVVEMVVDGLGAVIKSDVYRARVRNRAKLAYPSVGAWLEGAQAAPAGLDNMPDLAASLRLQDRVAQQMKERRHERGALSLDTVQPKAVFEGETLSGLEVSDRNRARTLIEDFMIAANGVTARFLEKRGFPSVRRVVRTPRRWDRIVQLAADLRYQLPEVPDPRALEAFLVEAEADDPIRFPDLSLSVIKLLGAGEYVAEAPGQDAGGHFGLAVKDYAHSTAPNRRYPDLITQRLLKAALAGEPPMYSVAELDKLSRHCTAQEDAAKKVERQVGKSAAALLLEESIGEQFEGVITGASEKGTWVRIFDPPVEGMVVGGAHGLDVGDRVRVRLVRTDVEHGFIDFRRG